jgi:hypothetical protein
VVLTGPAVTESPVGQNDPVGKMLTAVARCTDSSEPEAYGGGVQIVKTPGSDIVTIQSHYLGTYVNQTTVTPPSVNATQASSAQSANAYEAQAVVTYLADGHTVTITPYVVCGP